MNIDGLIQGVEGQMKVTHGKKGNEHSWKKWQGRPSRHQPRTRRNVRGREPNVPRGVRQAAGNRSALEILEACSCAKSKA